MFLNLSSTELDTDILEYLCDDKPALSAMSMVSKYYRKITEPILYRDLKFPLITNQQIVSLLLTVVNREEVARHARSVTIPSPGKTARPCVSIILKGDHKQNQEQLESDELKIRELALKARMFCPTITFADWWLGNIELSGDYSLKYSFDNHLALFLMQATNIEKIHLTTTASHELAICCTVISFNWQSYDADPASCPFNRLEDVCIEFNDKTNAHTQFETKATIPRSVKRFRLLNYRISDLGVKDSPTATLEELDLRNVVLSLPKLYQSLESE